MNDPVNIVQVCQPLQHGQRDLPYDIDVNGTNLLVNPVQRSLIHELHADADIGIPDERAVKEMTYGELQSCMICSSRRNVTLTTSSRRLHLIFTQVHEGQVAQKNPVLPNETNTRQEIIYMECGFRCCNRSVTEDRTDGDTLVRTQMVEQIAQKNIRHRINRTPPLGVIVSAARIPAVRSSNMNLPTDVAIPHPAPRHDGYRIQIVVNTFEVPVYLSVLTPRERLVQPGLREPGKVRLCVLALELNQFAQAGFPTLGVP